LVDMGYHTADLVIRYFGLPSTVRASMSLLNREGQVYDVEDTCHLTLDYHTEVSRSVLFGTVFVSRVYPFREERLTVLGTRGSIVVDRFCITRFNNEGKETEKLTRTDEWPAAFIDQINDFARWIRTGAPSAAPG